MSDINLFASPHAADRMVARPSADIEQLPDGIYLNLPPLVYFGQWARLGQDGPLVPRVGGSCKMTLAKRREGYWWSSALNPLKDTSSTDAQNYGSALHALMLEGPAAYAAQFMVEPDPRDYPNILKSEGAIRLALQQEKLFAPPGASKWRKAQWASYAAEVLEPLGYTVWDEVMRAFDETQAATPGRRSVTAVEHAMLEIMASTVMDADTPEGAQVRSLLIDADYPPLAEVSVLYHDRHGVPRRARLDRMFPRFDLDLKSLRGDWQGRDVAVIVDDLIRRSGYDIQRADYHAARRMAYAFLVAEGADHTYLHGGTPEQRDWLRRWPDLYPQWEWVWLFYQKPDMVSGSAPILFPLWDDHRSLYHIRGMRKGVRAMETYRACMAAFGPHRPWARVEPTHYTSESLSPHILVYDDSDPAAREEVPEEGDL